MCILAQPVLCCVWFHHPSWYCSSVCVVCRSVRLSFCLFLSCIYLCGSTACAVSPHGVLLLLGLCHARTTAAVHQTYPMLCWPVLCYAVLVTLCICCAGLCRAVLSHLMCSASAVPCCAGLYCAELPHCASAMLCRAGLCFAVSQCTGLCRAV